MTRGYVVCTSCGRQNNDPGGKLLGWSCGHCHTKKALVRVPEVPTTQGEIIFYVVAWVVIGAYVGGLSNGVTGALVAAAIGASFGFCQAFWERTGSQ